MALGNNSGVQCRRSAGKKKKVFVSHDKSAYGRAGRAGRGPTARYVRGCGRVRWFMAARMGATAMVSRQCRAAGSCPAAPRYGSPVPGGRRGFLFASVRWSSGILRIQCQDRTACRRLLIGRGRSIELSSRCDLMSSDCASGTCLVCAGAGTGGVVVVAAAFTTTGAPRERSKSGAPMWLA